MKAIYAHVAGALTLTLAMGGCVAAGQPAPQPTAPAQAAPAPEVQPTPTPAASPSPLPSPTQQPVIYDDYLDAPQTPGTWRYGAAAAGTMAWFGEQTDPQRAPFSMTCDRSRKQITLMRRGSSQPRSLEIETETTDRIIAAVPGNQQGNAAIAVVSGNDRLLDAMAITKGRFAVQAEGLPTLYLPAWTEVSRLIEDCR